MIKVSKVIILFLFIGMFTTTANAEKVFDDLENINTIKCSGKLISGSIKEHDNATYYYTFKNGKIYSPNLNNLFGDLRKEPKKVSRLKIEKDYITFKDRLMKFEATYYMWVKIDRRTGEYLSNAKNDYGFFFKRANIKGACSIEN